MEWPKCIRCKEKTWRVERLFDFNVYMCLHCSNVIKTAQRATFADNTTFQLLNDAAEFLNHTCCMASEDLEDLKKRLNSKILQ